MNGFIKVHRKIRRHWLWEKPEEFQAFFDLILLVEWAPRQREVNGRIFKLDRGQQVVSLRFLAKRFKWSKSKVERFLAKLEADGMLRQESGRGATVLTICNYKLYQDEPEETGTPNGTRPGHTRDTPGTRPGQGRDEYEEGKEVIGTHTSDVPPCSLDEAIQAGAQMMVCEDAASKWWHERDAVGWVDPKGIRITRWQSALKAYGDTWRRNENQSKTRNGHSNQPQRGSLRTGDQSDEDRYAPGRNGLEGFDTESPLR